MKDINPLAKGIDHQYKITGLAQDQKSLQQELETTLNNTLASLEPEEQEADLQAQEVYYERQVRENLNRQLRAQGYYDAQLIFEDRQELWSGNFQITPGPLYKINSITITPDIYSISKSDLGLAQGDPLHAKSVLRAQKKIEQIIEQQQCLFSLATQHKVQLNEINQTASLVFEIQAGPPASFGPVTFKGAPTVKTSYLQKLIPWKQGDCYQRQKIQSFKTTLLQTGLFAQAEEKLPASPQPNGEVPITFDLNERRHRTLQAGASFYTDRGISTTLGWRHRNLMGNAEKLDIKLEISTLEQLLSADFTKPHFLSAKNSLSITSELGRQDTDAFVQTGLDMGLGIQRYFSNELSGRTGANLRLLQIEDQNTQMDDTFGLISLPQTLTFDTRDNTLNPTRGWQLNLLGEPFFDILGASDPFLKARADAKSYIALSDERDVIFAFRSAVGSIIGAATDNIPASERFFAGGGGSVRGFGFQEIGPFAGGEPTGGRSLVEGAAELRIKMTENIGAVAFTDVGSVSDQALPEFNNLAVGAGVGARYYTDFGPLRLDIALPLSENKNTEDNYQLYISIGQAF